MTSIELCDSCRSLDMKAGVSQLRSRCNVDFKGFSDQEGLWIRG